MVGVRRFKLNQQLAKYLREQPVPPQQPPASDPSLLSYRGRRWRVRDRLSEQDIVELITALRHGTPKHELTKRYGIPHAV